MRKIAGKRIRRWQRIKILDDLAAWREHNRTVTRHLSLWEGHGRLVTPTPAADTAPDDDGEYANFIITTIKILYYIESLWPNFHHATCWNSTCIMKSCT